MVGRHLGRFEIIREIGKGAMGVVYLAHDPRIDRKIAIKMISLPAGVSTEEARETRHRFVREAQAAGKLAHPNIITIYDVVEEGDTTYIAMEFIDGPTLETHTRPGSLLPLDRVLSVVAQACSALDYAHKGHVIHRDIKPANLMLVKGDLLKITDFGLAKRPDANMTQSGVLVGTPNYMSPEQISGRPMDGRSDFFSLGVVLFELLTGQRPFGGDTISTIIYRILYEEPKPIRILNDRLPPAFDGILRKALAKDPDQRFQDGAEFMDALNNYSTFHLKRPVATVVPTLRVGRESVLGSGASQPVPSSQFLRGRTEVRARPLPTPAPRPFFAGQPFKVAVFGIIVTAALLIFPHRVQEVGLKEIQQAKAAMAAAAPAEQAGFSLPSLNTDPGTLPRPSLTVPTAPAANILVSEGAEIWLDGNLRNEARVELAPGDTGEHKLLVVNGCREKSTLLRAAELQPEYDMRQLEPRIGDLVIDTTPPAAEVRMDGKSLGPSPVTLPGYNACEKHTIEIVAPSEKYKNHIKNLDGTESWSEITRSLARVPLSEVPLGQVRFTAAPPFDLQVFLGEKPVTYRDGTLTLPEGEHKVTLRNETLRYSASLQVKVAGGKTVPASPAWPEIGTLTVQAEPSKCKIFVDGVYLDYPPVDKRELVAGKHTVKAVLDVDPSQTQEQEVEIQPGGSIEVKFLFKAPTSS